MITAPAVGTIRTLTHVTDYTEAERLVDRLSDAGFPVERVRIVGIDVYSVEQVTGRLTTARAALSWCVSASVSSRPCAGRTPRSAK